MSGTQNTQTPISLPSRGTTFNERSQIEIRDDDWMPSHQMMRNRAKSQLPSKSSRQAKPINLNSSHNTTEVTPWLRAALERGGLDDDQGRHIDEELIQPKMKMLEEQDADQG